MPDSFGNPLPSDLNISQNLFNQGSQNTFGAQFSQPTVAIDTGVNQSLLDSTTVPDFTTGDNSGSWSDNFFSNKQGGPGWGGAAIGAISGAAQIGLGIMANREGRNQNKINNQQWQAQFDIQKGEYDRRVAERSARVAANNANRASVGG